MVVLRTAGGQGPDYLTLSARTTGACSAARRRSGRCGAPLGALARTPAVGGGQLDLAQPREVRCDLDGLVLADELQRLVQRQVPRRREPDQFVGRGGAHVGELLLLGRVDVHVLATGVLSNDHTLVDLGPRAD